MKLIPIKNVEDKIFFGLVPRVDFAVFMFIMMNVGFVRAFFSIPYWVELLLVVGFIFYLITKRNLEKKEQSLFVVLWANSRIPHAVIGVFRQKRFGVRKDEHA